MTPKRFELIKSTLLKRQADLTVVADGIHKTHNIAAVIRSCDAVGALDVYAVSPNSEIPRHHATTAGVSRWSRLHVRPNITEVIDQLRENNMQILAAHQSDRAVNFRSIDYCIPTAIILGTELDGVSLLAQKAADQHIYVPMNGMVESLNVSVAAAVVLYEAQKQRERKGLYQRSRLPSDQFHSILFEWCYPDIAQRCRSQNRAYPQLDEDGQMLSNPLAN